MHVIGRVKLENPIIMANGDRLRLVYVEINGVVRVERPTTFAVIKPDRAITVTEAVLFEQEFDGRYALGAMLLEAATGANVMPVWQETDDDAA